MTNATDQTVENIVALLDEAGIPKKESAATEGFEVKRLAGHIVRVTYRHPDGPVVLHSAEDRRRNGMEIMAYLLKEAGHEVHVGFTNLYLHVDVA